MLAQKSGGSVASVFGRTGVIIAQAGDYAVNQVTGAAPLASPAFTGTPTGPTPATADNSTKLATTAYVQAQAYAPLASPTFTGTPAGPTATVGTNTTQLATCAFVLANSSTPAGSTDQIQFNGGSGAFGASSSLTWNPTDSNISVGPMLAGGWHVASAWAVIGNNNLDQTVNGNFAVVQSNTGQTVLNSSTGNQLNLRVNNVDFAIFNNNSAIAALFTTNNVGANISIRGMSSQSAPLLALQAVSSTSTNRDAGYLDAGLSHRTDASYTGFIRLMGVDHASGGSGREGIRCDSSGTAPMLSFFGATTVVQPTAGGVTTGYTAGSSTAVTIDGTFTGGTGTSKYTIADIVAALKNLGLIAP